MHVVNPMANAIFAALLTHGTGLDVYCCIDTVTAEAHRQPTTTLK